MTYRKNWFDYALWAVYAGLCVMLLAYVGNSMYAFYIGESLAALGTFLPFPVLLCLYPAIRQSSQAIRKSHRISGHFCAITESLLVSVAFVFGTILRIRNGLVMSSIHESGYTFQSGDYYELARVTTGGGGFSFPHGIDDLFVNCLRTVLSFLGNSVSAACLFQVFLQVAAMLFAYLAVRKAAGRFAACTVLLTLAFSYSFNRDVGVIAPKCLLTVLFLAGLYLVISFVNTSLAGRPIYGGMPGAFLLGVVLGFLCYLEAGCGVLFLFLAGLFTGKPGGNLERKQRIERLLIVIVGGLAGLFGAIAEDASLSGVVFYQGLLWWTDTFFSLDMERMRLLEVILCQDYLLFLLVFLSASFVVFEFIRKGCEQAFSLWFLPCILVTPVFLMDFSVAGFGGIALFFWSVMAGLGLKSAMFGGQAELVREKIEGINASVPVTPEPGEEIQTDVSDPDLPKTEVSEADAQEKPRFIENPLPLPKKHVKRTMDYDYEVAEEDMHYDVEIDAENDFDQYDGIDL